MMAQRQWEMWDSNDKAMPDEVDKDLVMIL